MNRSALLLALLSLPPSVRAEGMVTRSARLEQSVKNVARGGTALDSSAQLLGQIDSEPDPHLRKFAITALLRARPHLSERDHAQLAKLAFNRKTGVLPRKPSVPQRGPIEIRHYTGSEFVASELENYRRNGFNVLEHGNNEFEGTRGRLHVIMRGGDKDVLRDIGDAKVNVIFFSGHSNYGGVVETALSQPKLPAQNGDKLIAFFQCSGTQTLPLRSSRFPRAHMIGTRHASNEYDDQNAQSGILRGLSRNSSYREMRGFINRRQQLSDNYIFPDQLDTVRHADFDRNGQLDRFQKDDFDFTPAGRKPTAGEKLMSGVRFWQIRNVYDAKDHPGQSTFDRTQASADVRTIGLVDGDGSTVIQVHPQTANGRVHYQVGLDRHFENESKGFIGAASVYEAQIAMEKELLGRPVDDKMKQRAISLASQFLFHVSQNWQEDQQTIGRLRQLKGVPGY